MMAEEVAQLVREVERVVTAPYIPSLQNLYTLVQNTSRSGIQSWALQKPCQVELLAALLVENLARSRVALPLLTAFGHVSIFRDHIIGQEPILLDALLEKAVVGNETERETQYHAACTALLSSPLPAGFVPPARLAGFISKLVSIIAANPQAQTIAPLHTLMIGIRGSPSLLDEIPTEVMSNMQTELTKTLRNLDDHMGNLLGLATFAEISSSQRKSANGRGIQSWLMNAHDFFGPRRGMKTLDLVVLRVILACSSNCNSLTPSQAAESIRLAVCIADAVDPDVKSSWISQNASKIAKLCEKVSRDNSKREIQIMEYDESVTHELLQFIVDTLTGDVSGITSMVNLQISDLLLSEFKSGLSQPMVKSVLGSASTKHAVVGLLERFPVGPAREQCQDSLVCYCACSRLQNQNILDLFEIFTAAAISHGGDSNDAMILRSFVARTSKSLSQPRCAFSQSDRSAFRSSFILRDRRDFSSRQHVIRDWRAAITETYLQVADMSHSTLLKKVEEICFDLERRCYDVEEPVRSIEKERDFYRKDVEQLKQENAELTNKLEGATGAIAALQKDLTKHQELAGATNSRAEELARALELARQELHSIQSRSSTALQEEKEKLRSIELELIVTSTEKDELLEELQESLRQLESANESLEQTRQNSSKEKMSFEEKIKHLENEAVNFGNLLETKTAQNNHKEGEIERLLQESGNQHAEIHTLRLAMENQSQVIEQLRKALQETGDKAKAELEAFKRESVTEIAILRSDAAQHHQEISRLKRELQTAANNASNELQTKEKRIRQLERKVQSLRDERAAKAREFSEAQQHIGRLMNVMGFSTSSNSEGKPTDSLQRSRAGTEVVHSQSRGKSIPIDDEDEQDLAESFESLASNLQGPTLEGLRGGSPSSRTVQIATTKAPTTESNAFAAVKENRQALVEANRNNSVNFNMIAEPKSGQPAATSDDFEHENGLQHLDLDMELELPKDFFSASTTFSGSI
ncbi:hypothetical protein POX_g08818 [Penicillium oxalicum]|uniref:hypothetical protein n=1 Tax=Penicillium oxalicum TaxID=69781 RepID=UPI0020B8A390|nr:hypothetical protein POX_g08818 [Penicillium oxalicum]KAI2786433.1 hypothetical protein POX_g08818 [Penicillium oxalicum]